MLLSGGIIHFETVFGWCDFVLAVLIVKLLARMRYFINLTVFSIFIFQFKFKLHPLQVVAKIASLKDSNIRTRSSNSNLDVSEYVSSSVFICGWLGASVNNLWTSYMYVRVYSRQITMASDEKLLFFLQRIA